MHKQKGRKHALLHQSSRFSDPGGADKILLAVDDSLASRKATNYVADLARRKKELNIHIFHALVILFLRNCKNFVGQKILTTKKP